MLSIAFVVMALIHSNCNGTSYVDTRSPFARSPISARTQMQMQMQ